MLFQVSKVRIFPFWVSKNKKRFLWVNRKRLYYSFLRGCILFPYFTFRILLLLLHIATITYFHIICIVISQVMENLSFILQLILLTIVLRFFFFPA